MKFKISSILPGPGLLGKLSLAACLLALGCAARGASLDEAFDELFFKELSYSGIPIVGYDDKSGWLYGGAGFAYRDLEPAVNIGLFAVSNFDNFHSATLNYEQRTKGRWFYGFHGLSERAFDIYYGEGDLTNPNNPLRMGMYHFEARPVLLYKLHDHFRAGVIDDYRSRLETSVERVQEALPGDPAHVMPDESTDAFGLRCEWDTRDKILSPNRGDYFQFTALYGPPGLSSWPGASPFAQLQIDLRTYATIHRHLVLAGHLSAGSSIGEPSYLFRYRLGGLDLLRGYKDNRFRGKHYVLAQEEGRYFFRKWISVNLSLDAGDIGDDAFRQLKLSAQAGLRIGLPPDWGQKCRVDLGYGFDQSTFQIQFGEIF